MSFYQRDAQKSLWFMVQGKKDTYSSDRHTFLGTFQIKQSESKNTPVPEHETPLTGVRACTGPMCTCSPGPGRMNAPIK